MAWAFIFWRIPKFLSRGLLRLGSCRCERFSSTTTLLSLWRTVGISPSAASTTVMEPALTDPSFTHSEYEHINCVRMHLQVATLSDISDGNGQTVNRKSMEGQQPKDRQSPRAWHRQPSVTEYQVKLWVKYLRTHFVTEEGLHLWQSLGKLTSDSNLEWRYIHRVRPIYYSIQLCVFRQYQSAWHTRLAGLLHV